MRFYMFIAVSILFFTGCQTSVLLEMPISGLNVPIEGGNGHEIIVVTPFSDNRNQKDHCGMRKNGHGFKTKEAFCNREPSEWIGQLLADELRASGFKVLDANAIRGQGTLKIEGSLLKLYVEQIVGIWTRTLETDLQVKLIVTTVNGLNAEQTFFAKGVRKGAMMGVTPYNISLKRATNELLTEMVEAIFYLTNKYPQIGMSGKESKVIENQISGVWR